MTTPNIGDEMCYRTGSYGAPKIVKVKRILKPYFETDDNRKWTLPSYGNGFRPYGEAKWSIVGNLHPVTDEVRQQIAIAELRRRGKALGEQLMMGKIPDAQIASLLAVIVMDATS